jgi:nucleoside-diphosphate-sugar epimerase
MRVAVTGAAGFLGTNLTTRLAAIGHKVRAICPVVPYHSAPENVSWIRGDVLDAGSMRRACAGADIVYHLAAVITLAHNNDRAWRVNTRGVRIVAEAALAAGARLVHCSSIHAYDLSRCEGRIDESSIRSQDPRLPVYDRSKWQGELEVRALIDAGLDGVVCNPTAIVGPVDYRLSRINAILCAAARGRVPVLVSGAFDLVDVRDVVAGLIAAGEKGQPGENYLLAGQVMTLVDACRLAAATAGRRGPVFAVPLRWTQTIAPIAEPLCRLAGSDLVTPASLAPLRAAPVVSSEKAQQQLGYTARPPSETIRDFVGFLADSGQLRRRRRRVHPPAMYRRAGVRPQPAS